MATCHSIDRYAVHPLAAGRGTDVDDGQRGAAARSLDAQMESSDCRARYYDPTQGRFISRDPRRYTSGSNVYQYVRSRAPNSTDPFGLEHQLCPQLVSAQEAQKKIEDVKANVLEAKKIEQAKREQFVKALNKVQEAAAKNPKAQAKAKISAVGLYTEANNTKTVNTVAVQVECTKGGFEAGESVNVKFGGATASIAIVTCVPAQDTVYFSTTIVVIGAQDPVRIPYAASASTTPGGKKRASYGPIPAFKQQ